MLVIKVPINVNVRHDYTPLFLEMAGQGVAVIPYLSSSAYGLRNDQYNPENFNWYLQKFYDLPEIIKEVQFVFNTRAEDDGVVIAIDKLIGLLRFQYSFMRYRLIINSPQLIKKYSDLGCNVAVSSASIASFKKVIDLVTKPITGAPRFPQASNTEFILPSTINHLIPQLPANSFTIMINNGCRINCIHAATKANHSVDCPNQHKGIYTESPKQVDVIRKPQLDQLIADGWKNFKISGRQADPSIIEKTVRYYLGIESGDLPYIDSHLWYGESKNI